MTSVPRGGGVFDAGDPGYSFASVDMPERTVDVLAARRGQGLGGRLLRELIALAQSDGLPALSLSVEPENFASHLCGKLAFVEVGYNGGAATMLLSLGDE